MKNLLSVFTFTMVLLLACASVSLAQDFQVYNYPAAPDAQTSSSVLGVLNAPKAIGGYRAQGGGTSSFPGDNAKFFTLLTNGQFFNYGQGLVVDLMPLVQMDRRVNLSVRLTFPQIEKVTTSRNFYPEGASNGSIAGLDVGQQLPIFHTSISRDMAAGEYQLDVVMTEDRTGILLQQTFVRFYVQETSFGLSAPTIEEAFTYTVAGQQILEIHGQFPSSEFVLWMGVPGKFASWGPRADAVGGVIRIASPFFVQKTTGLMVNILFPDARFASTVTNVLVKPEPTPLPSVAPTPNTQPPPFPLPLPPSPGGRG